jgi:hypothetical protein
MYWLCFLTWLTGSAWETVGCQLVRCHPCGLRGSTRRIFGAQRYSDHSTEIHTLAALWVPSRGFARKLALHGSVSSVVLWVNHSGDIQVTQRTRRHRATEKNSKSLRLGARVVLVEQLLCTNTGADQRELLRPIVTTEYSNNLGLRVIHRTSGKAIAAIDLD